MTKKELEKEADEYAREWLYHVKNLELHHKEDDKPEYIRIKEAYLAGAEPREKRIEELKEEGKKSFNDWLEACNKYGEVNLKLTKAKEIIKTLADDLSMYSGNYQKELLEAKQFLKEIG